MEPTDEMLEAFRNGDGEYFAQLSANAISEQARYFKNSVMSEQDAVNDIQSFALVSIARSLVEIGEKLDTLVDTIAAANNL